MELPQRLCVEEILTMTLSSLMPMLVDMELLYAVEKGLKVSIVEGDVIGGTCVNRGCVPSKALRAMSDRMHEFQNEHHLKSMGLQVASPDYDKQGVADHANNLASDIHGKLTNSMKAKGVDILIGTGSIIMLNVHGDEDDGVMYSQLNLIDLAGSESSKTETTGLRRKGGYINKSHLTLGTIMDEKSLIKKYKMEISVLKQELDQVKKGILPGITHEEIMNLKQQALVEEEEKNRIWNVMATGKQICLILTMILSPNFRMETL